MGSSPRFHSWPQSVFSPAPPPVWGQQRGLLWVLPGPKPCPALVISAQCCPPMPRTFWTKSPYRYEKPQPAIWGCALQGPLFPPHSLVQHLLNARLCAGVSGSSDGVRPGCQGVRAEGLLTRQADSPWGDQMKMHGGSEPEGVVGRRTPGL